MMGLQVRDILGTNVKRVRKQLGLTQAELAEKAGISSGYICDIERSRRWPSAEIIAILAKALKVDPYLLLLPSQDSPYFDRIRTLPLFADSSKRCSRSQSRRYSTKCCGPLGHFGTTITTIASNNRGASSIACCPLRASQSTLTSKTISEGKINSYARSYFLANQPTSHYHAH